MAVIKAINSKGSVGGVVKYVADKNKTSEELMYGKDCSSNPDKAIADMTMTKELYNKDDGRQYKHFVQSFNPKDKITPEKAHEIGKEWAEKTFKGYEVFVATHTDKAHMHNHFIVNAVNFETGEKYRQSTADLARYKELSNKLCEREGLTPTEPNKTTLTSFNNKKYKAIEKGMEGDYKSYMLDLWKNVNSSMKKATNKDQFIESMKEKGYGVNWSDTRKHITFETPEGKKVRNSNLAKTFKNDKFTKEGLLNEFGRNGERDRNQGGKPTVAVEFRPSDRNIEQDIKQANEPIRGGTYESGEYGAEKTTSELYDKLREIRSIGDEYSPDARADARERADRVERELKERAEQLARERIEHQQSELAKSTRVTEQQPNIKPKLKRSHEHGR